MSPKPVPASPPTGWSIWTPRSPFVAHTLADGDYRVDIEVTGTFNAAFPAPDTVNLDDLTTRRISRPQDDRAAQ